MTMKSYDLMRIITRAVPKEEGKTAWAIYTTLQQLESFVDDIESALVLFDFCLQQQSINPVMPSDPRSRWSFIAARDGACPYIILAMH
jgi:hypothetical protein